MKCMYYIIEIITFGYKKLKGVNVNCALIKEFSVDDSKQNSTMQAYIKYAFTYTLSKYVQNW